MKQEDKVKKIAKSLLKKADVLTKLYGADRIANAKTTGSAEKAVGSSVSVMMGYGIRGKIAELIKTSIERQLNDLSIEEMKELTNFVFTELKPKDVHNSAKIHLIDMVTGFMYMKASMHRDYAEKVFQGMDSDAIDAFRDEVEIVNDQDSDLLEVTCFDEDGEEKQILIKELENHRKVLQRIDEAVGVKQQKKR